MLDIQNKLIVIHIPSLLSILIVITKRLNKKHQWF